ncbi:MAG: hypothetical protein U5K76_00070 [Woeseiaceae bacterium]|nr:hypothetical protein [Woeseiaceae bacterium]
MPDLTALEIIAITLVAIGAAITGWLLRGSRCRKEKQAVNAGWQLQVDARQAEQARVVEQNTRLMEQISQFQASSKDVRQRARDLSDELKQAYERRDQLYRQIKEIRGNLELVVAERDRARTDVRSTEARQQAIAAAVRDKDERIAQLKRELARWSERVPPLVERYRAKDLEAQQLGIELARARDRIAELERQQSPSDETRIEPVDGAPLHDLDASNDQYEEDSMHESAGLEGNGDDLQRIKGIGPSIEKTLKSLGIRSFARLASLSEADIEHISARLRGFRTRIKHEDWAGQARRLQANRSPPDINR